MGFRNLETTVAGLESMEGNIRRGQFSWWAVAPVEKKNKLTRVWTTKVAGSEMTSRSLQLPQNIKYFNNPEA